MENLIDPGFCSFVAVPVNDFLNLILRTTSEEAKKYKENASPILGCAFWEQDDVLRMIESFPGLTEEQQAYMTRAVMRYAWQHPQEIVPWRGLVELYVRDGTKFCAIEGDEDYDAIDALIASYRLAGR